MDDLIASSTTLFSDTTGFAYADLVTWSGDVLKLILGAGLGLVDAVLGWIIAFLVIAVIVGLIYHGLRWMRILR